MLQLTNHTVTKVTTRSLSLTGHRCRHVIVRASSTDNTMEKNAIVCLDRRGMVLGAGLFSALQLMATPLPALALIPDDDDEDMIEKAKANRKKRLAGEKQAEKEFSRSEGFVDKNAKQNLVAVQLAVNALAKVGEDLAQGDVAKANGAAQELNINKLEAAIKALSINADSQNAGGVAMSELNSLLSSLNSGSIGGAKKEYVDSVIALTDWTVKANVTGLQGI
jgi:hypothetical protein